MEWTAIATAIGAIAGQYFKSLKNVPTWVPQTAMLLIGTVAFVAYHPPALAAGSEWWVFARYWLEALVAGASVNGLASILGLHPALATDTR
jgi:hypothetical protein